MSSWNGLDFFIFLIIVVNFILGMSRGATKEIIGLICLSVALIFTIQFTVPLAHFLNSSPLISDVVDSSMIQNFMGAIGAGSLTSNLLMEIMYSISILICFVGVFSICEAALVVTGFVTVFSFPYATLDRKVGAAIGLLRGYIFSLILLCILSLHIYAANGNLPNVLAGSFFANLFQSGTQTLDSLITGRNVDDYSKLYQNVPINEKNIYDVLKLKNPDAIMQQQQQQQQ